MILIVNVSLLFSVVFSVNYPTDEYGNFIEHYLHPSSDYNDDFSNISTAIEDFMEIPEYEDQILTIDVFSDYENVPNQPIETIFKDAIIVPSCVRFELTGVEGYNYTIIDSYDEDLEILSGQSAITIVGNPAHYFHEVNFDDPQRLAIIQGFKIQRSGFSEEYHTDSGIYITGRNTHIDNCEFVSRSVPLNFYRSIRCYHRANKGERLISITNCRFYESCELDLDQQDAQYAVLCESDEACDRHYFAFVKNNNFYNCGKDISITTASYYKIENNVIENFEDFTPFFDEEIIAISGNSIGVVGFDSITDNFIKQHDIALDLSGEKPYVLYNEIIDQNNGARISSTDGPILIRNLIHTKGPENFALNLNSGSPYLLNNTLYNTNSSGETTAIVFENNSAIQENSFFNNILWNYTTCILNSGEEFTASYNCFNGEIIGDVNYENLHNIFEDPKLENPANREFTLQWNENNFSPCIDTGDPDLSFYDDDGTPADMGCYPAIDHKYDKWKMPTANEHHGIKWMSLPVLNDLTNSAEYDGDIAAYLLEDIMYEEILDTIIWKPLEDEEMYFYFVSDPGYWENDDHIFTSPQGYKFKMFPELEESVPLEISGLLVDTLTTIELCGDEEENWIGYFCEKTNKLKVAFAQIWHNLSSIKTQHWSLVRYGPGENDWLGDTTKPTLSYGDMVIVKCYDDDFFTWNIDFGPGDTYNRPETEHFDFVEELDYIPVFIEHDPDDIPVEVGVFIDDVCKGAAVVEDNQTQVNGYILNNEGEELDIRYFYDDRSEINIYEQYQILDPVTMQKVEDKIVVNPADDYYLISFKEENDYDLKCPSLQINSYPNPVIFISGSDHQNTTISYSIPSDSYVSIKIFNIKGQLVKDVLDGDHTSGSYQVIWNGKNNYDQNIGSGIYFYKIESNEQVIIKKNDADPLESIST